MQSVTVSQNPAQYYEFIIHTYGQILFFPNKVPGAYYHMRKLFLICQSGFWNSPSDHSADVYISLDIG